MMGLAKLLCPLFSDFYGCGYVIWLNEYITSPLVGRVKMDSVCFVGQAESELQIHI